MENLLVKSLNEMLEKLLQKSLSNLREIEALDKYIEISQMDPGRSFSENNAYRNLSNTPWEVSFRIFWIKLCGLNNYWKNVIRGIMVVKHKSPDIRERRDLWSSSWICFWRNLWKKSQNEIQKLSWQNGKQPCLRIT